MISASVAGPDGEPARGDACLVTGTGAVKAIWPLGPDGRAHIEAGGADFLLVRCVEPVIAAKAVRLVPGDAEVDVVIEATEVVGLSGAIAVPLGTEFDWVDLHVTPRRLEWVPDALQRALLAVDTGAAMRGTYWSRRLREPRFDLRVARGLHGLRVSRFHDGPLTAGGLRRNLTAAQVTATPALEVHESFGEFELQLDADAEVLVTMRSVSVAEQT